MELIDFMSGIGGAWVGYHAVRIIGLACFRIGAAVREWRFGRPANVALRLAKYAMKEVDSNNDWIAKRHADFEVRLQALEEAPHSAARIAILEERVEDIEGVMRVSSNPTASISEYRDVQMAYFNKHGKHKKKDLPN